MHDTGTLSCPFPISSILKHNPTILPSRLSFEVKLTDVDTFYELKCRLCADGSRMTEGIDFSESYAPTSDADSFRLIIALASSKGYWLIFYDVSNAFQTNVIDDPSKRHYLRLPPLYQQWFKQRWPTHPLHSTCHDWKQLVLQTLRNLQGTKDAGHEWYQLLSKIF